MPKDTDDPNAEIQELLDSIEDEPELPTTNIPKKKAVKLNVPEPKHDPQHIEIVSTPPNAGGSGSGGGGGGSGSNDAASGLATQIMGEFGERTTTIWSQLIEDRALLDKYIEIFNDRISDPEKTKTAYVEALTTLLNTKATTSMNATKMLDSIAKMIAAIKNMKMDGSTDVGLLDDLLESNGTSDDFDPENP